MSYLHFLRSLSLRSLACHPHLLATPVTARAPLLLAVVVAVVAVMAHLLWTTTTEIAEDLPVAPVVTALVAMTATAAEARLLATMTTVEIPTLAPPHLAPVVPLLMTTHRQEAAPTLLMTVMVLLLRLVAMRLTHTPMVTAENPESPESPESLESLTVALPALLPDVSVVTMRAMTVDLTGDYFLLLNYPTETSFRTFVLEKLLLTLAQDSQRFDHQPPPYLTETSLLH